jgi:hypothetical protein
MLEPNARRAHGLSLTSPVPLVGRWDNALLLPVAEINQQMLAILCACASTRPDGAPGLEARPLPRLVAVLRELWCSLDLAAQRRLALCPYLLLDGGFSAPERWQRASAGGLGVMDGAGAGGYFSSRAGVALLRRTFVLAWHLARANALAARILLGMSPDCAERIAACPLAELEALAELGPVWVVPRWELQPHVWRQMLQAALADRAGGLRPVQLRGLQLLASDGEQRGGGAA